MHQFEPKPDPSAQSAAMDLVRAWIKHQQEMGYDPAQAPVDSLAGSLNMSEEQVRRLVEEARVERRSKEIAANILAQEGARRKKLDSAAALGAAISFVLVIVLAGAFYFLGSGFMRDRAGTPVIVEGDTWVVEPPPVPDFPHLDIQADQLSREAMELARREIEMELQEVRRRRAELEARGALQGEAAAEIRAEESVLSDQLNELRQQSTEIPVPPPTPR